MYRSPVPLAAVASTDHVVRAWHVLQAIKAAVGQHDDGYLIYTTEMLRRVARLHGVDVR